MSTSFFSKARLSLSSWVPYRFYGKVSQVSGTLIKVRGLTSPIGEHCFIQTKLNKFYLAKVIAIQEDSSLLMSYFPTFFISIGDHVTPCPFNYLSPDYQSLPGRVINAFANPLDNLSPIRRASPPLNIPSVDNQPISDIFSTGIRAIDGFLTIGIGQRVAIFSEPGNGKSSLLTSISQNSSYDLCIFSLIGERSREAQEFLLHFAQREDKHKLIAVIATAEQEALTKILAAELSLSIAQFFREQGLNVLFIFDSLSRYCEALQEVGLSCGESFAKGLYPASVFHKTAQLIEGTGKSLKGSITSFFSFLHYEKHPDVLVDYVKSLLDGHIFLDNYEKSFLSFPPINLLTSLSRSFHTLAKEDHRKAVSFFRKLLKSYEEHLDVLQLGAYSSGSNEELDQALSLLPKLKSFLTIPCGMHSTFSETIEGLLSCLPHSLELLKDAACLVN